MRHQSAEADEAMVRRDGGGGGAVVVESAAYRALFMEVRASRSALEQVVCRNADLAGRLEQSAEDVAGLQQALAAMSRLEAQVGDLLAAGGAASQPEARDAGFERRLEQIEARLRLLEMRGRQPVVPAPQNLVTDRRVAGLEGRLDSLAGRLEEIGRAACRVDDVEAEVARVADRLAQIGGQLAKWHELQSVAVEQGALVAALFNQNRQLADRVSALECGGAGSGGAEASRVVEAALLVAESTAAVPPTWADAPCVVQEAGAGEGEIAALDWLKERSAGLVPSGIIRKIRQEMQLLGLA